MLTIDGLITERPHSLGGGVQRLYRWGDYGLSVVNPAILHHYTFAWEAAVLKFKSQDLDSFELDYSTELTEDVEVFMSDEETNLFIERAKQLFCSPIAI